MKNVWASASCAAFIAASLLLGTARDAFAHDGPPYPVMVDHPIAGYSMDVWADPDVGEGTFFVISSGGSSSGPDAIDVSVTPSDGHLAPAKCQVIALDSAEDHRVRVSCAFDRVGLWRARFVLRHGAMESPAEIEVEVTPPGGGPLSLLWYLSPFLAVGFLWIRTVLGRRERAVSH